MPNEYRPWGLLDWALNLSSRHQWGILGALGTEERSLASWKWLRGLSELRFTRLLEIHDLPSKYTERCKQLLTERQTEFYASGGQSNEIIRPVELLTELHKIIAIGRELESLIEDSIILDITSLPKRFFFPLLRYFLRSNKVNNLVVTYAIPEKYDNKRTLSEKASEWLNIPGFQCDNSKQETLVASVGFMVESMQSHIAEIKKHESIKLLIPFPAAIAAVHRAWESIYRLEEGRERTKFAHYRIPTIDLNSAFNRITVLASETSTKLSFAPFGPKPISAAMCLYASQKECSVHYPQPSIYNPDYSKGTAEIGGKQAVYAYWIKHEGKNLYRA
ncbi:MAG: hypothetical protein QM715_15250 [Nibricoccus sp.]